MRVSALTADGSIKIPATRLTEHFALTELRVGTWGMHHLPSAKNLFPLQQYGAGDHLVLIDLAAATAFARWLEDLVDWSVLDPDDFTAKSVTPAQHEVIRTILANPNLATTILEQAETLRRPARTGRLTPGTVRCGAAPLRVRTGSAGLRYRAAAAQRRTLAAEGLQIIPARIGNAPA